MLEKGELKLSTPDSVQFEYLHREIASLEPDLTVDYSSWNALIPFAFWVMEAANPRILVELGTESGVSYCAFCQAVSHLKLPTVCYAVDTWSGDSHTGPYGPDVLQKLTYHHEPRYGSFSRLIQSTFDEAVKHFSDGSIDLLHIDGYHTYEAVKHDFNVWLPKLSEQGIVLFHDINARQMDFGVWRFWDELIQRYPSFCLLHCHGLGVIGVGEHLPNAVRWLLDLRKKDLESTNTVRTFFHRLGGNINSSIERKQIVKRNEEIAQLSEQLRDLQAQITERNEQLRDLQAQIAVRNEEIARLSSLDTERLQAEELLARNPGRELNLLAQLEESREQLEEAREQLLVSESQRSALTECAKEILEYKTRLSSLENSLSWRITKPLRQCFGRNSKFGGWLRFLKGKAFPS
jgi:O-antigen biosynthesis protein